MKIGKKQSTATSVERSLSENEYLRISCKFGNEHPYLPNVVSLSRREGRSSKVPT